jgi:hypothetical protein
MSQISDEIISEIAVKACAESNQASGPIGIIFSGSPYDCAKRAARIALESALAAQAVAVVPLTFEKQNVEGTAWCSEMAVGGYYVVKFDGAHWIGVLRGLIIAQEDSRDKAMAAAQKHHSDGILSALAFRPDQSRTLAIEEAAQVAASFGGTWSGSRDVNVAVQEAAVDDKVNEIVDAIRALSALASPPGPQDGWRPIETAPKDGRDIILGGCKIGPSVRVAHWGAGAYNRKTKSYDLDWTSVTAFGFAPTHWQPLPVAPKPEATE